MGLKVASRRPDAGTEACATDMAACATDTAGGAGPGCRGESSEPRCQLPTLMAAYVPRRRTPSMNARSETTTGPAVRAGSLR